jgi:hypothetical protein
MKTEINLPFNNDDDDDDNNNNNNNNRSLKREV